MSDKTMGRDEAVDVLLAFMPKNLCLDNTNVPDSTKIPLTASLGELRRVRDALTALTAQPSAQPSAESMLRAFIERYESRYTRETMVLVMAEVTARARELDAAHPAPQQPEQPAKPELCGCGKPAEYMTVGGGWCCNKYGIKCRPQQPADKGEAVADGCWVGTITAEAGGAIDWRGGVHALYRDFAPGTKLYAGGKPDQPGEKVRGLVEKWLVEVEKYAGTHAYVEGMRKCADELAAALSAKGEGE